MRFRDSYHPYAILTILFWSLAYVLTRLALKYFTAYSLGFLRYAVASIALAVIVLAGKVKAPQGKDFVWFLPSGFFGFFLYMVTFNQGCVSVTAATSSIVIATVPVMTALLARIFYREKLSVVKWVATGIEFSGVIVLTALDSSISLNSGLVWLLLAAVSLSSYNLLQRKITRTYSGLQASAYSIFIGTVLLAVFLPQSVLEIRNAPLISIILVVILGVFSSAIAYVTWGQAMKKAKHTALVSNYMFVTPFLAAILGYLLANETPNRATVIGGAVIMTGVLLFSFGDAIKTRLLKNA